jgi:chaperonin GroES
LSNKEKNMKIRPLADRVLVRRSEEEAMTAGGIALPSSAQEKATEGVVVAVGPGKVADNGQSVPMGVKVGDHVLYGKYAGTELKLDGEDLIIMNESDIMGVKE